MNPDAPDPLEAGDVTDVSDSLADALAGAWTQEKSVEALHWVAANIQEVVIDWEAPEDWGTLILQDQLVAHVWMRGPLVLLRADQTATSEACLSRGLRVISVRDFNVPCLTAAQPIVNKFCEGQPIAPIDGSRFAANDLWYATI
jgi:hypothetical protein